MIIYYHYKHIYTFKNKKFLIHETDWPLLQSKEVCEEWNKDLKTIRQYEEKQAQKFKITREAMFEEFSLNGNKYNIMVGHKYTFDTDKYILHPIQYKWADLCCRDPNFTYINGIVEQNNKRYSVHAYTSIFR